VRSNFLLFILCVCDETAKTTKLQPAYFFADFPRHNEMYVIADERFTDGQHDAGEHFVFQVNCRWKFAFDCKM